MAEIQTQNEQEDDIEYMSGAYVKRTTLVFLDGAHVSGTTLVISN